MTGKKIASVEDVLKMGGMSASEIASVKKYDMVKGTKDSANDRDLAAWLCYIVKGVEMDELRDIFITSSGRKADPSVTQMANVEDDEVDVSGKDDPFATIKLTPNGDAMTKLYLSAKVGSCGDLNLSAEEIEQFAALPKGSKQSDVETVLKKILAKRMEDYQQRGLEGIAPYCRGKGKNFEPGQELAEKCSAKVMPILEQYAPEFRQYLLDCPNNKPAKLEESFSWVNFTVDEKPNICLVHKCAMPVEMADGGEQVYVYCQRHFYVMRGHNSVQGIGGAFPVSDAGKSGERLMLYISRTSTDQVSGFGGSAKRALGSRIMGGKIADNMERLRQAIQNKK